jgi:hypothetical protein
MARRDPHSYNDDQHVATAELALLARIDFAARVIHGQATLTFHEPGGGTLDLDTRELTIDDVVDHDGAAVAFTLHEPEPFIGARLSLMVGGDPRRRRLTLVPPGGIPTA